jgi:NAD(P)-dependent dehydrogenase (short-subunit alcohol dehydrogenase family)
MTRSALVTGGNSGIGLEIAEALGRAGYRLWLVGRDADKGEQAVARLEPVAASGVEFLRADLSTAAEVNRFAQDFKRRCGGKLDVLVHSTGVLNSKRKLAADGTEETWASQFLCRYLLTEALTPELSAADDGRVVFVAAPLTRSARLNEDDLSLASGYSMLRAAQQSQLACQLYIQSYAAAHPKGPAINAGHVGIARTGIFRNVTGPMKWAFSLFGPLISISAERAAKNFVALASDPALKGVTGHFFPKPERLEVRKPIVFDAAAQAQFARLRTRLPAPV